jgi:hypothetical protein
MVSDKRLLAISLFILAILILIFSAFQTELKSLYLTRFLGGAFVLAAQTADGFARREFSQMWPSSTRNIRRSLTVLMLLFFCMGAYLQEPRSSQFAYGLAWVFLFASAGVEIFDTKVNKERQS